jgi:ABC-2 type transport system permease protein
MRECLALIRAAWLTECSYRLNMAMSLVSLALIVVPLYFVSNALQPLMASTISSQSQEYFAFTLVGALAFALISTSVSALPTALGGALGRGTLEAFLATPTSPTILFTGMSAYSVLWALVRGAVLLATGVALGVHIAWGNTLTSALILGLLLLAYAGVGLIGGCMLLCFRTTGPLLTGVLTLSAFLGGVYYPTHVIPSWLQQLSKALPLTYGLRALRQSALRGEPFAAVSGDVGVLALQTVLLLAVGGIAMALALRHARRTGTLSHY